MLAFDSNTLAYRNNNMSSRGTPVRSYDRTWAEIEDMLNKASYYYAQALLIFVYLIPEDDKEEKETNENRNLFKEFSSVLGH